MIRNAVELKELIEDTPNNVSSIGTSYSHCFENDRYPEPEEYDEDSQEYQDYQKRLSIHEKFRDLSDNLKEICHVTGKMKDLFNVTIRSPEDREIIYQGSLSELTPSVLEILYDKAPDAAYGDLKNLETVVDSEVRKGKDVTSDFFEVDQKLLDTIQDTWSETPLYPTKVIAKPYKINLYREGDHFQKHQDTPNADLVGTFLIGLCDESKGGGLVIHTDNWYNPCIDSKLGSWVAFYPNVPHEVTPIVGGIRATMSFKIHVDKENIQDQSDQKKELIRKVFSDIGIDKYGIILSHGYSLNPSSLKGNDYLIAECLKEIGLPIDIIPILIKIESYYDGDSSSFNAPVYPLIESPELKERLLDQDIPFFSMGQVHSYQWKHNYVEFCDWAGNECQPEEENSLYLNRAIIVNLDKQSDESSEI
jgi:hypothetical protein